MSNVEGWCAEGAFFLKLIYGAKHRLPSIFGVPYSSFDIPAKGGSFSRRSPGKA
jgi:hypothetical protein